MSDEDGTTPAGAIGHDAPLSRRRMLKRTGTALAAIGLLGATGTGSSWSVRANETEHVMENAANSQARIVLVHGAFADGTGWQHVIPPLDRQGFTVTAVQNPLASLANDVATTRRVLEAEAKQGPVIAVGHSYGGAVIGAAAAGIANVKALVFIAAFAPEVGEPVGAFLEQYPSLLGTGLAPDSAGFLYIDRAKFREIFAKDVDPIEASVMAATQKPIFGHIFGEASDVAGWKTIPSWYLLTTEDNAVNPDLQRFYAKRMNATTVEIASSHAVFVSRPQAVVKLIEQVANAVR